MKTLSKLALFAVAATVLGAGSASAIECPNYSGAQIKQIIARKLDREFEVRGLANRDLSIQGLRQADPREIGGKCYVDATLGYTAKHPAKDTSGTVIYRLEIVSGDDRELCFGKGNLRGGQFGGGPVKSKLDKKRAQRAAPSPFCAATGGRVVP